MSSVDFALIHTTYSFWLLLEYACVIFACIHDCPCQGCASRCGCVDFKIPPPLYINVNYTVIACIREPLLCLALKLLLNARSFLVSLTLSRLTITRTGAAVLTTHFSRFYACRCKIPPPPPPPVKKSHLRPCLNATKFFKIVCYSW